MRTHSETPTCWLSWDKEDAFDGPLKDHLDESAFYKNPNTTQIDSRLFLYILGLNRSENEIYRTLNNDAHVTQAGVTVTSKGSLRTKPKSAFIETFKLLRYTEHKSLSFSSLYGERWDSGTNADGEWMIQDVASTILSDIYFIDETMVMVSFNFF